jgi:DNA-binding NarL/FixJ family response regulator
VIHRPDIIVVDDHLIFRQGLTAIISTENIANVIAEAGNGDEFLRILPALKPDLVLMDINMPGINGVEATMRALEMVPDLKIIVYTMFGNEEYFLRMLDLGVKGFILKSGGIMELEQAIETVMEGGSYFTQKLHKSHSHLQSNQDTNPAASTAGQNLK